MPKAFIPDRDMPRKDLKPREYSAAMVQLRERVKLGEFLARREEHEMRDGYALVSELHDKQHRVTRGWAKLTLIPFFCGRCHFGDELWDRYEAGFLQPIYPVDEDQVTVASIQPAPRKARLPHLPFEGFRRKNDT